MPNEKIRLHPIAQIWPPMTEEEYEDLKDSIATLGLKVPVLTWGGAVVDGKHRLAACEATRQPVRTEALPDGWTEWQVAQHCAALHKRRNLSAAQRAMVAAELVEQFAPAAKERQREGQRKGGRKAQGGQPAGSGPAGPQANDEAGRAATQAAEAADASPRAVRRARRVAQQAPEAAEAVKAGTLSLAQGERIAKAPKDQQGAILKQLHTTERVKSDGDSWGTPSEWIELARTVMGGIDLDPASNRTAQKTVQATRFLTEKDNGLTREWKGRVWLNPPYSHPAVAVFAKKLVEEVAAGNTTQACVLVNNATDTKWGQLLLAECSAVALPAGRVSFLLPDTGKPITGTRQGQMLLYFGEQTKRFVTALKTKGWVGRTA